MIVYPYNDNLTGYRNPWSGDNARESVEHAFICLCLQAQQTHAHAQIKGNELHHQSQISFHWHLAMLFLMLLIGMLPKSCSGACTTAHLQCPFLLPYLEINPTLLNTLKTPPQRRSRQNPKRNSKPPSMNASKGLQKAIARTVRMERLGSGTCQGSPKRTSCSLLRGCLLRQYLTLTSRNGTCLA